MAEFQEVMRQWGRMCNSNTDCGDCPMRHKVYCLYCSVSEKSLFTQQSEIENIVMQWAAEHPEPVYPTWGEWLCDMHVVGVQARQVSLPMLYYTIEGAMQKPIPADIAQKLGIKPKE